MSDAIIIRSMLFADVVGFSRLSDPAYPPFMTDFLAGAARILADPAHTALVKNTWGDAIFAVFATQTEAARAALKLHALGQSIKLPSSSGETPLKLRIGLHSGPVHEGYDAITNTHTYMGRHINLAARIEPIALEGHVYVSGEFAAIAALKGGSEFVFDYVGQQPLPKNAGVIPVFKLSAGSGAAN